MTPSGDRPERDVDDSLDIWVSREMLLWLWAVTGDEPVTRTTGVFGHDPYVSTEELAHLWKSR